MIGRIARLLTAAAAVALASCGGGGGTCAFGDGCPGGGENGVADLVVTLSTRSITNSGSDSVTAVVTALNSNRATVSGASVAVSVDANAVATVSGTTTGSDGTVSATVGTGSDKSNRTVTVTATSGSLTRQASFQVTGTKVTSTYANTVTLGSTGNTIHYLVTDINAAVLGQQEITVSAPGLTTVVGTTTDAGTFDYTYDAPGAAGSLVVTATVAGVSDVANIQVQASGGVPDADGVVDSASLSANPATVSTNSAGSTTNQSQIRALFVRTDNRAVKNVRVRFDLDGDPNGIGGTLSSGSDILYSAADGTVTVSYAPGTRSSPTEGVTIRACWGYTDAALANNACPNAVRKKLTVTAEAISVTLGTNGQIEIGDSELTYIKKFVVLVADSAGNAMPDVNISSVLDLPAYRKGYFQLGADSWQQQAKADCANEDVDRDGVLDEGEDINHNNQLDPRKADAVVSAVGSAKTDSKGMAILQIEYPQSVGSWVFFNLKVTGSGISGTEGSASYADLLPVLASAVSDTRSSPAFQVSPYGIGATCDDPN